jgi:hypothetical protein
MRGCFGAFCSHDRGLQDEPPLDPNRAKEVSEIIPKKEIISDAILWAPLFTVFFVLFHIRARDPPFLLYEGKAEVGHYTKYTG